jgi:anti-anti-sigma regulatory factor
MLRITVHDSTPVLTFQIEGRLVGSWVHQLEECWHSITFGEGKHVICVDLTGVTSIDTVGKACLTALHQQGAEFVAADCVMKAVVAEITSSSVVDRSGSKRNGEGQL